MYNNVNMSIEHGNIIPYNDTSAFLKIKSRKYLEEF